MSEEVPVRVVDGVFDDEGLLGGECGACGRRHFPSAGHCPWCGAAEPVAVRLATDGTLWAWTSVQSPPPGYVGPVPFGFGVVTLDADGLRVVTRLTESDVDALAAGDRMVFTTVDVGEGAVSWAFAPATGTTGRGA